GGLSHFRTRRRPAAALLDLGFLEDDVLARDRVVLLELELFRRGARVLARDVVVAGVGRTHELDHDRRLLGHRAPRLPCPGKGRAGRYSAATPCQAADRSWPQNAPINPMPSGAGRAPARVHAESRRAYPAWRQARILA